jgi:hypothetical protein
MRIREENRNIFLLGAVTLCCAMVAATLALFEPVLGQAPAKQLADSRSMEAAIRKPIRVIGAPFVPNVNPRER